MWPGRHEWRACGAALTLALALALALSGCSGREGAAQSSPSADTTGQAVRLLASLAVQGRAPMTGYDRDRFGPAWSDDTDNQWGHNGCDTRNDILRRDLTATTFRPGTHECIVLTGTLHDPYTGKTISFVRGEGTSAAVQIEHVVALADAWQTGAQYWSETKRQALANDPLELLAVDGPTNEAKGAGDAASWLPPNTTFRCAYVARQVAVKARYGLWVTKAEHDAIARVLSRCPTQDVPAGTSPPVLPSSRAPATSPTAPFYRNCDAARAAGAAPLHRGQPGYRPGLDADGDGVACES